MNITISLTIEELDLILSTLEDVQPALTRGRGSDPSNTELDALYDNLISQQAATGKGLDYD